MGRMLFDFGYTAYLGDVIVRPEYQGQGIGTMIVTALKDKVMEAAEPGDKIMFILGAAKGKEAFYEQFGFKKRPNDFNGSGMSMWREK
jgi:predicted N-acetyltransferase YhbS